MKLSSKQVDIIFPYHISISKNFNIISIGAKLASLIQLDQDNDNDNLLGTNIQDLFTISSPFNMPWDLKRIQVAKDSQYELTLKSVDFLRNKRCTAILSLIGTCLISDPALDPEIERFHIMFLLSVNAKYSSELSGLQMKMSDLPKHSFHRELIFCNEHLKCEINNSHKLDHIKKSLVEEQSKAQMLLETKRGFVRYVSHEIRTPLNIVCMGLQLLEESHCQNNEMLDLVHDMKSSSAAAVDILNDLLMYEKIESNLLTADIDEVNMMKILFDIINLFRIQAKSSGINLIWNLNGISKIIAKIDTSKFSQVIRNLVSNALKFTPHGGTVCINMIHSCGGSDTPSSSNAKVASKRNSIIPISQRTVSPSPQSVTSVKSPLPLPLHPQTFSPSSNHSALSPVPTGTPSRRQSGIMTINSNHFNNCSSSLESPRLSSTSPHLQPLCPSSPQLTRRPSSTSFASVSPPPHRTYSSSSDTSPVPYKQRRSVSADFGAQAYDYYFSDINDIVSPSMLANDEQNIMPLSQTNMLRISVVDSGHGISDDDQKKLFSEFKQVKASKLQNGGGSGLGLWVSKRIVDLHSGNIGVYSAGEGLGSTFYVDIPVVSIEESPEDVENQQDALLSNELYKSFFSNQSAGINDNASVGTTSESVSDIVCLTHSNSNFGSSVGKLSRESTFSHLDGESLENYLPHGKPTLSRRSTKQCIDPLLVSSSYKDSNSNHNSRQGSPLHSASSSCKHDSTERVHRHTELLKLPSITRCAPLLHEKFMESLSISGSTTSNTTTHNSACHSRSNSPPRKQSNSLGSQNDLICDTNAPVMTSPSQVQIPRSTTLCNLRRLPSECNIQSILLVDDAASNRKMVHRMLRDKIPIIHEAHDGKHALDMFATFSGLNPNGYDIIMMDYEMPHMNGPEVVRILRSKGYKSLIVGVTGNSLQNDIDDFKAAGVDEVMIKPVNINEFVSYSKKWMGGHR